MYDTERHNRERELSELGRRIQRRRREFQEDLNQSRNEELSGILNRVSRVLRQIDESEKLGDVFQRAVWADPRIDMTKKVIRALDDNRPAAK